MLITGGCGFIGSHFCRYVKRDASYKNIINIDCLYPCATRSLDLTQTSGNYTFIEGNINDQKLLTELLKTYEIEIVVHFAAQSHVDLSFTDPLSYTKDNVLGTHNLLEAIRSYGKVQKFIHISTDEVYGENDDSDEAKTENSLLKPTNPYAASKAAAEMLVNSYITSYKLPAIIIRSNNIYGPCQYPEKVIPKFIYQIQNNELITLHGDGEQRRSFLYVDDVVSAILCIIQNGVISQVYNVNSECEITVKQLALLLLKILRPEYKNPLDRIVSVKDRNFNDKRYFIKGTPLKNMGWRQMIKFNEGLQRTIDWYVNNNTDEYWVSNYSNN